MLKKTKLSTGATVSVNHERVRVDLPSLPSSNSGHFQWQFISSAILNGGCQLFETTSSTSSSTHHVLNYKVPSTYDGLNPPPQSLLGNFTHKEQIDKHNTVGMLTAASMETFAHSSRSAMGVTIDVIVTAGLSNSRSAGADADYFVINEDYDVTDDDGQQQQRQQGMKPGTINTIIIVNAPLTQGAQVEAYAVAIEAKVASCVDHGVTCAKESSKFATGTGTDCAVFISQCYSYKSNNNKSRPKQCGQHKIIKYAGKHTLFAEMIGQAVYEATSKAIMINILYKHYNYATYTIHRWVQTFIGLMTGAMPLIPPKPMMPIPRAPLNVVYVGIVKVLSIYFFVPLPDKAKLLLAAVAWDRYLREPPLKIHPVCIAGSMISACLARIPDRVYNNPFLGFTCGLLLLLSMVLIMTVGAWMFMECNNVISLYGPPYAREYLSGYYHPSMMIEPALHLLTWIMKLLLLKSTFSLQLLCTLALQMAKFIERDQIDDARAQLSWLCSRDPSKLGPSDLAGGTLESLSENLSDGFVAPLFWYVIFGPIGALAYRVINTLDSRVGYRGKYEWVGKPSARLDDVINYIPARITTVLLALSAGVILGHGNAWEGLHTAWADHEQCESPNAGWPMACFAGLLGVQLKKEGSYCLGARRSNNREPTPVDIRAGHRVAELAGGLTLVIAIAVLLLLL
ncbi:hypothetical protein ACHAXM_004959 [Skeletonema potamos]